MLKAYGIKHLKMVFLYDCMHARVPACFNSTSWSTHLQWVRGQDLVLKSILWPVLIYVKLSKVILCWEIRESYSLHIYIFLWNKSIWPIDGMLMGTTMPDQSGPESNGNKEVLHSPELKPHHQMQFSIIPWTPLLFFGGRLTPFVEDTVSIFKPHQWDLVWFYGISTIVGYLMPYMYIYINSSILYKKVQFCPSTQFKYQKQFYFKLFSLVKVK